MTSMTSEADIPTERREYIKEEYTNTKEIPQNGLTDFSGANYTTKETENSEKNDATSQTTNHMKYLGYFEEKIVWKNALGFLFMHILGTYGVYLTFARAKFSTFVWFFCVSYLSGMGVTVGAHRLFSHKCFKAAWGIKVFLLLCHTIAGQNCMYVWVRDHRQHHKFSDTEADPHNSKRGFFFSHMGWLMMRKKELVKEKGKTVDMSDLEADPLVMFQKKYYKPLYFLFATILPIGVPWYFLEEKLWHSIIILYFTRYVVVLNITWLVNSAAHIYGTKPYNKNIKPVESGFVSFCSMGEGWHNYHHSFPWDYRAAELGSKWDGSTRLIDLMAKLGWVYDLKQTSNETIKNVAMSRGDGSHPLWGHGREMKEEDYCEIIYRRKEE